MSDNLTATQTDAQWPGASTRPLRILHVLDHSIPLHSGYSFRTLAILREQRRLGWDTFQLTGIKQGTGTQSKECIDGWTFYRTLPQSSALEGLPLARYRYAMRALQTRMADVVKEVCPDILHAHSPVLNAFPALAVARKVGIPIVYEVRAFWEDAAADHGTAREWGPRYRLTRLLETRALRAVDAVTTLCEGLRDDMLERGIPADKITVIPNAVDPAQFRVTDPSDTTLMEKYGLKRGVTLGFAGSFYAYEGLDILLRAMPLVVRAVPAARLLLLGGGPQEANLKTLVAQLGIDGAVHFTGRVPHADVKRYYEVMDVMVYPRISRRLTELVTPLKPLEAMAMSKLVVASDVGGHRELIRDGQNGYLFAAGSIEALACCLIAILKNPDRWPAVIARGREYIERERYWQASAAHYQAVYTQALNRGQQKRGKSHAQ